MKLPNQSKCGFLAFLVMFCGAAMAQNGTDDVPQTSGRRRAYAYGFVGGGGVVPKFVQQYTYRSYPQVLNQGTREVTAAIRFGVGGGVRITRNLYGDLEFSSLNGAGAGGENSGFTYNTLSPGLSYHILALSADRFDPFVSFGYDHMWNRHAGLGLGFIGGGAHIWAKRFGLRLEYRSHIGSVSSLQGLPENIARPVAGRGALHLWELRVGIALRI